VVRVTQSTMALTAGNGLQQALATLAEAQTKVSSGRRINKFSDAPIDATSVLRMRAQQRDLESFRTASDDGLAWLATQDQALQGSSSLLTRVKELGLQAANSQRSQVEREAIAVELESLSDQLASLANTTYLGKSVFGGFQPTAVTKVGSSWTWTGDTGGTAKVERRIAPDVVVQVNLDGEELFGFTSGTDVFGAIETLTASVRGGDPAAVMASLGTLDARADTIRAGLGVVGSRANQLESMKDAGAAQIETLRSNSSALEHADLAEAVLQLTQAEGAYQSALAAAARLSLPSLVQFLG
jgi:flagellar hook-associated protein 3 FlgL